MIKKILSLLLCGIMIIPIGCGKSSQNTTTKTTSQIKEEQKNEKDKEKYDYILNSDKSYIDINTENNGVNYRMYADELISGAVKYDSQYDSRIQELREQKTDMLNEIYAEKKAKMDSQYSYIKVSENVEESKKEIKNKTTNYLNKSEFSGRYNIYIGDSSADIKFDESVKMTNVSKLFTTNLTREIYQYYQDEGLIRTDTELKTIYVYITIEGKKFTSHWKLGESPEDDWN